MSGWRGSAIALSLIVATAVGTAACSSDSSTSTDGSTSTVAPGGTTSSDAAWCTSVENLVEQSPVDDVSVSAALPELSQALTSLATTAPAAIASDMQTLASVSQAAVELTQSSPGSTLPAEAQQQAADSWAAMDAWVATNCGVTLPALVP
jgi:hypothetical protein